MHVGVFPCSQEVTLSCLRLPHARGGVSGNNRFIDILGGSSPCTWGCFQIIKLPKSSHKVFPMHVGVFLYKLHHSGGFVCLPHARGGVSSFVVYTSMGQTSSPCTWGCFSVNGFSYWLGCVFPMHVGVFLASLAYLSRCSSLPHARGGVSSIPCVPFGRPRSSPCTWGCFPC